MALRSRRTRRTTWPLLPSLQALLQAPAGSACSVFALVRACDEGRAQNGHPYVDLVLADATATVRAKVWHEAGEALAAARGLRCASVVKVAGIVRPWRGTAQLDVRQLRLAQPDDPGFQRETVWGEGADLIADLACATLVFDIETVPAADRRTLPPTVVEALARHAQRQDLEEGAAMGLSPFFGRVVSLAIGDGERSSDEQQATALVVPPDGCYIAALPSWIRAVDERTLLAAFWALAAAAETVVTFNGRSFDVPFLVGRSLVHGVPVRVDLLGNPWALRPHLDLYRVLAPERARVGPTGLDVVCWALGIPSPKGDMDGSMVASAYERGEIERIAAYNAADVRATTAVYHRLRDLVLRFRPDA